MKLMIQSTTRASLLIAAIVMLAACGQKGPLYLPQSESKPAAVETPETHKDSAVESATDSVATPAS